MPCPVPVFWGVWGCVCIGLRTSYLTVQAGNGPRKWAAILGTLGGCTGDTQGPFPGVRVGWWKKATPRLGTHRGIQECPRVPPLWGGEAGTILGLIPCHEGAAGPGWSWAPLPLPSPLVWHEATRSGAV